VITKVLRWIPLACALLLLWQPEVATQPAQGVELLRPSPKSAQARPEGKRVRRVRLNPAALRAQAITVEFFDGAKRTYTRKDHRRIPDALGSETWVGESHEGGEAVLTTVAGGTSGVVFTRYGLYELTRDTDGEYTLMEVNPEAFPPDAPPVRETVPDAAAITTLPRQIVAPVFDVLIVWTPQAEASIGGPANMKTLVANAIALTNRVYVNSQVNASVRLVYAGRVEYRETTIHTDLSKFRGKVDGMIDHVHALREQYGADLMAMFGNTYKSAGYCGLGGLMAVPNVAYAATAFTVTDRRCATANLSFPHELGHNQGLQHDPPNAASTPSWPFAYGHQDPAKLFRTVMSYGGAPRRPYLSNPNVLYSGKPTGVANARDNARALNANAGIVSSFRATAPTVPPTSP
jgi:hypothetical protein